MIKAGTLWKKFKSMLVTEYVPPNYNPCSKFDFITETVWDEFVAYKSTEEFKNSSEEHRQLQAMNKHPHRHGSGGYANKIPVWEAEDEEARENNLEPPFSNIIIPRARNWTRARVVTNPDGSLSFPSNETARVARTLEELSVESSQSEIESRPTEMYSQGLSKTQNTLDELEGTAVKFLGRLA